MGVGEALGSFVTRLRGGGRGEAGVAEKHAVTKVKDKRQNVKRKMLFNLIGILEVFTDEIRNINGGMGLQNTEEIIGCDDLAITLCEVILKESKEGFITNAST